MCGSGLAREGGVPVAIDVADTTLSRASPLPQGELWSVRGYLIGEKSAAISSFDSIFSSIGNAIGTNPSSQSAS
ncbi:hypothetical protein FX983_02359 [Pseudomonas frederiksbergensis]|uniref:Uncharacterized protein n=1 Tax=Pseudomonas frederiksbergensis TaxID=104087 RepID=A0A6L5C192_9PSED|nr:hypothetical protein FX983_02359 [Pseudomonas frederiksbergensis]